MNINEGRVNSTPLRWSKFESRISMKNIILFIPIILMLFSCGPSVKEKEEIAVLTCNILESSFFKDGAFRINEVNDAREQIGEDRFLGTDNLIQESLELGLCKELVLNEKNYEIKIKDAIDEKYTVYLPTPYPEEEIEDAEILIDMGPSGEISMNGLRIDISAVRENVERIIAENPQRSQSVVIQSDENATTDNIIQIMDAAREAGIYSISLASKPIN